MNEETVLHTGTEILIPHDVAHHDGHHEHHQSFISKYVFSQDHKMISKQFLITGIIWATKVWRKRETIEFMSKVSGTPELDELEK